MSGVFFNDREGQTILSNQERLGLNLKHITNLHELDEAEQMNINEGLIWLTKQKGDFLSEGFFRKLHKKLFGQVWKWAGQYRTSEKNIGIAYWKIGAELNKLCNDTKYWLENSTYNREELLAHFHHRLVYIHPFPNGNGRFSRIMTNHLCKMIDLKVPDWHSNLPPQDRRKTYIEALRAADLKDFKPMIEFFK